MIYFDKNNPILRPSVDKGAYILYAIDEQNRIAGIDYPFFSNNSESVEIEIVIHASLQTAFDEFNLNKIYVNVIRENRYLFRLLQKYNFVFEAIHREQCFKTEKHDILYLTVLKHEWKNGGIRHDFHYGDYSVN